MLSDPEDLRLLVCFLRVVSGYEQKEMAAAARVSRTSLHRYERGKATPRPRVLKRLAAAAGVRPAVVDFVLLPAIRAARAGDLGADEGLKDLATNSAAAFDQALSRLGRTAFAALADLDAERGEEPETPRPRQEDRLLLPDLWARFEPRTAWERGVLVESSREFQSWALCERLAEESVGAAADSAERALELARQALRLAELVPGEAAWRSAVQGYVWGFVANAHRVGGDLREAERAFARAWKLWGEGKGSEAAEAGLLAEWRLLDLEASLRCDQRRWPQALDLHDRARAAAPRQAAGHILLNKAFTLEKAGTAEAALALLREAAPLLDETRSRRLVWVHRINLATSLCHLGRFSEAEALLLEVRQRAEALGNELDLLRVLWLSARVAAGLDRRDEARAALEQVRLEFAARGNGHETALVSQELAAL